MHILAVCTVSEATDTSVTSSGKIRAISLSKPSMLHLSSFSNSLGILSIPHRLHFELALLVSRPGCSTSKCIADCFLISYCQDASSPFFYVQQSGNIVGKEIRAISRLKTLPRVVAVNGNNKDLVVKSYNLGKDSEVAVNSLKDFRIGT